MTTAAESLSNVRTWLGAILVGQPDVVDGLLTGCFLRGHVLLEGVPGVGKTLLARSVAAAFGLSFRRVQGTPDLMPSDLLGTHIFRQERGAFQFRPGPIFTDVLLMDEINRTPPKTQSALLEAMEERQVTVEGETFPLSGNFFVIATQNPVEFEGVYPLPEAQLDRFTLKLTLGYPDPDSERRLIAGSLRRGIEAPEPPPRPESDLAALKAAVREITVSPEVAGYAHQVIQGTRKSSAIRLGASPRAGLHLLHAARAYALVSGRSYVLPDDVKSVSRWVLSHRILLQAEAELEGVTVEGILDQITTTVAVPR